MTTAQPPRIFDRRLVRLRRTRSASRFQDYDFLHQRAMPDIIDRLETVKRDFPLAAFSGAGGLVSQLTNACGVGAAVNLDAARPRLPREHRGLSLTADEEASPFAPQSLDLYVSLLTLHTANDLIGALSQIRMALKPDGLFIAVMFGEDTLAHLRKALYQAESEATGGVSARIAPFATVQDAGQALFRAGFALPVVDIDNVRVRYPEPFKLFADLRGMGETRALTSAAAPLRRDIVARAMALFSQAGGEENFDLLYMTGWAPHESQQKPLRPGSAKASLAAAVKGD